MLLILSAIKRPLLRVGVMTETFGSDLFMSLLLKHYHGIPEVHSVSIYLLIFFEIIFRINIINAMQFAIDDNKVI